MRVLLVAPLSKDTALGVVGNHCRKALINIGVDLEVFDFRASQCFNNPVGSLFKRTIRKAFAFPRKRIPFLQSLEQEKMNSALLYRVEEFSPDVVLVIMGDTILTPTLERIKLKGAVLANWFLDTVLDPDRKSFVEDISAYYDYFFVYDAIEVRQHIDIKSPHIASVPLACCPEIHRTVVLNEEDKRKFGSEICFVGSMKYKREELLRSLKEFELAIWGNWIRKDPQLRACYRQKNVYDDQAVKIYNASGIALDIHMFYGLGQEAFDINPRVYESTACGAFTITNESPYLSELYEIDKEIVCYKDERDLKEKINYYLRNPAQREIIAKNGQRRAHRDHIYEKRLGKIISIIGKG